MSNKKIKVITGKGIEIICPEIMEQVKKKKLSASLIPSIKNCPADWFFGTFILPNIEHTEPIYFSRGKLYHSVMEKFFAIEPEKRDAKLLKQICIDTIEKEYPRFITDSESKQWLADGIKNFYEMRFNYKNLKIATITNEGEEQTGLENFVSGNIGKASRPFVGFVDMVLEGENGLRVVDWKTGKKVYPYDPEKPISDKNSFDYWRQGTIYAMLMEQQGNNVDTAELWFPIAKDVVTIDCNNKAVRKQVIQDAEEADALLTKCIEDNLFPFHNALFCGFCSAYNAKYRGKRWPLEVNRKQLENMIEFID